MPSFSIRNENYRDELIKFSYPFDELSSLEEGDVYIGTDLIIDAIIHLKTPAVLPLHISEVDGTHGSLEEARFIISDNSGTIVGFSDIAFDKCQSEVYSPTGVYIGVLVFNLPGMQRFIGRITGKVYQLSTSTARFSIDVCHVSTVDHLRYVEAAGTAVDGTVTIVARHGVKFDLTDEGALRLSIVGDPVALFSGGQPVLSVNGVRNRSIWLANHPRANLRIASGDNQLTFIQAKDSTS